MPVYAKGLAKQSLYHNLQWEMCEGTEDLTADEAAEFIRDCMKADKQDYGFKTTKYEFRETETLVDDTKKTWDNLYNREDNTRK